MLVGGSRMKQELNSRRIGQIARLNRVQRTFARAVRVSPARFSLVLPPGDAYLRAGRKKTTAEKLPCAPWFETWPDNRGGRR